MKKYKDGGKTWGLGLLIWAVLVGGCSLFTSSNKEEHVEVTLTNNTDTELIYRAFAFIDTDIDPRPFKVDSERSHVVSPQDTVSLVKEVIKGGGEQFTADDNIRIFVWEVVGDSAFIKQSLTYVADKLKEEGYSIEVENFNSSCTESSVNQQPSGEQNILFDFVSNPELTEEQAQYFSTVWNGLYTAEVAIVRLADNVDSLLQKGQTIRLNLPHGEYFTAFGEHATLNESGSISWSGPIQNIQHGSVTLVYKKEDITGTIKPGVIGGCSTLMYKLSPISGGLNALSRLNPNTGIHFID